MRGIFFGKIWSNMHWNDWNWHGIRRLQPVTCQETLTWADDPLKGKRWHIDNEVVGPLKWVPLWIDMHVSGNETPRNEMVLHPNGIKNKLTWMVGLLVMEGQWDPCQQAKDVAHTVNVAHTIAVFGNCLQTFVFYTSRELHIIFHWEFDWVLHHFIDFNCWMDKMISIFC